MQNYNNGTNPFTGKNKINQPNRSQAGVKKLTGPASRGSIYAVLSLLSHPVPFVMILKDYYKILEVPPTATLQEIRQSFRRLAHRYHPDKNPENPGSDAYFKEVREAYEILSDSQQRETYNYRRWHQRVSGKKYSSLAFSPQVIFAAALAVREYMETVDIFRMNQEALYFQLCEVLSEHNLNILAQFRDQDMNRSIIENILASSQLLNPQLFTRLAQRLKQAAGNDQLMIERIDQQLSACRKKQQWQSWQFLFILLATLLLSLLIYFVSK